MSDGGQDRQSHARLKGGNEWDVFSRQGRRFYKISALLRRWVKSHFNRRQRRLSRVMSNKEL